nr:hypothetical protein [Rhizobium laguerreae]
MTPKVLTNRQPVAAAQEERRLQDRDKQVFSGSQIGRQNAHCHAAFNHGALGNDARTREPHRRLQIRNVEIGKLPRVQKPRDVAAERVAGQIVQRLGKTVSPEIVTGGGLSPAL